ncbi:MAG: hypothetical protein QXH88_04325 [Sulfolobales archaeon]
MTVYIRRTIVPPLSLHISLVFSSGSRVLRIIVITRISSNSGRAFWRTSLHRVASTHQSSNINQHKNERAT